MVNTHKRIVSPGELLTALINSTGLTRSEFAVRMGIEREMLYKLMGDERRITPMYARAIEYACRIPENLGTRMNATNWLETQAAWDLHVYDAETRQRHESEQPALIDQVAQSQRRRRMISGTHRKETV